MENNMHATQGEREVEIDLGKMFRVIGHNMPIILLGALVCGLISLLITAFLIKPTYRTGFTAYVNNHSSSDTTSSLNSGDTSAAQSLAYTYAAIMSSRAVLTDAAKQAGLDYSYSELSGFVTTSVQEDTQLVNLNVTMQDPEEAYHLAKVIENIAPDYIADTVEGSSMKIVSGSVLPTKRYSPSYSRNITIGAVLGFLVMMLIFIIRELTDKRIKNSDTLEEQFGIPVIGTIPNYGEASSGKTYKYYGKY
ncbi:MAG: YveK family protein [Bilifractor sp.]|jgi:capsular polysaccharide biosynthesis protein